MDSPSLIEKFLTINEPPTGTDLSQLSAEYSVGRERMQVLDVRLAELHDQLRELTAERNRLRLDLNDYYAVLHPIRRCPAEVLSGIFLECINPGLDNDVGSTSLEAKFPSWTLAQVSSRWRTIALSYPKLWSTIRIWIPDSFDYSSRTCRNWVSMLGTQLYRSALHPLSVSIISLMNDLPLGTSLLQVLLPTSPRWKELLLGLPLNSFHALADIQGFLPKLSILGVGLTRPYNVDELESSPLTTLFQFAPALHTLMAHPSFFRSCVIPWNSIKNYSSFTTSSYRGASTGPVQLELLSLATNLEVCQLYCRRPKSDFKNELTISGLTTLTIEDSSDDPCMNDVLERLTLPSLRELRLLSDRIDVPSVRSLVQRSKFNLHHLFVRFIPQSLDAGRLVGLLQMFPQLKTLDIETSTGNLDLLLQKLVEHKQPLLVSSLELLTLYNCSSSTSNSLQTLRTERPQLKITSQSGKARVTAIPPKWPDN